MVLITCNIFSQFIARNSYYIYLTVVSKDSNAFKLASKYDVDLVISASTLQVLAGTVGPLFKRTWDIPFSVRDHNVNGNLSLLIAL